MVDKHLKKHYIDKVDDDPLNAYRSVHFKKDQRTNSEKVQDGVVEAGQETRSVNQVVKLVNVHLSEKVKKLQKLKEDSKRFDEELNMFASNLHEQKNVSAEPQSKPDNKPGQVSNVTDVSEVSNDLLLLINKYGFGKLSTALDNILSQNPELANNS